MPCLFKNLTRLLSVAALVFAASGCNNNIKHEQAKSFANAIDSLLLTDSVRPFNGSVILSQNGKTLYIKHQGYSDFDKKTPLTGSEQFVIGSISKQVTAVVILQQMEQGKLKLSDPIGYYLPGLKQPWAGIVTIHQLLNHTHGITGLNDTLAYKPGSRFAYSQLGYELLGRIAEKTSGQSYAALINTLFKQCGMSHSSDPGSIDKKQLVKAYTRKNGKIVPEPGTFDTICVPAGWIVSTLNDLVLWNGQLHVGKILQDSSYKKMTSASSSRMHSVWGQVDYGYGIQLSKKENITEIGHTGYVPGYIAMNFYYPDTKTSLIMLENLDWADDDISKVFYFEKQAHSILLNRFLKQP